MATSNKVLKLTFTTSGALNGKKDIRIIDTTTNDLYDPPQVPLTKIEFVAFLHTFPLLGA